MPAKAGIQRNEVQNNNMITKLITAILTLSP